MPLSSVIVARLPAMVNPGFRLLGVGGKAATAAPRDWDLICMAVIEFDYLAKIATVRLGSPLTLVGSPPSFPLQKHCIRSAVSKN